MNEYDGSYGPFLKYEDGMRCTIQLFSLLLPYSQVKNPAKAKTVSSKSTNDFCTKLCFILLTTDPLFAITSVYL